MRNLAPGCCSRVVQGWTPLVARACKVVAKAAPVRTDVAAAKVVEHGAASSRSRTGTTRTRALAGGEDDHYRTLGVSRSATAQDIRSAFRKRARQCHPDVNKELGAGEQFKSVRLAYEILLDDAKRREYDASLPAGAPAGARRRRRQPRTAAPRYAHYSRVTYNHSPERPPAANAAAAAQGSRSTGAASSARAECEGAAAPEEGRKDASRDSVAAKETIPLQLREAAIGLWIVAVAWHAFGAHAALTLLVAVISLRKQLAVGYRVASGVAWLIGGEKGLLVAASVTLATLVCGRPQEGTAAAIVALALWLGGCLMQAIPFPPGAILVMAYKCIELQAELEVVA